MSFTIADISEYINQEQYEYFLNNQNLNYALNKEELKDLNEKLREESFFKEYFENNVKSKYSILLFAQSKGLDVYFNKEEEKFFIENYILNTSFSQLRGKGYVKIKDKNSVDNFIFSNIININNFSFENPLIPNPELLKAIYPSISEDNWILLFNKHLKIKDKLILIDKILGHQKFETLSESFLKDKYINYDRNDTIGIHLLMNKHACNKNNQAIQLKVSLLGYAFYNALNGDFTEIDNIDESFLSSNIPLLKVFTKNINLLSEQNNKNTLYKNMDVFNNQDFCKSLERVGKIIYISSQMQSNLEFYDYSEIYGKSITKLLEYYVDFAPEQLNPIVIRNAVKDNNIGIFLTEFSKDFYWKAKRKIFFKNPNIDIKDYIVKNENKEYVEINKDFLAFNLSEEPQYADKLMKRFISVFALGTNKNNDIIINFDLEDKIKKEDYIMQLIEITKAASTNKDLKNMQEKLNREIDLEYKLIKKEDILNKKPKI